MAEVKFKAVVDLEMHGEVVSHSRTDCTTRDALTIVDEPEARGGTNKGLTPTETLWASLLGCTNVIGHRACERNDVTVKDMDLKVEYTFDRRGGAMKAEVDNPFPKATVHLYLTTDADDAAVEKAKADLEKFCPVSRVIRNAGCDLETVWHVTKA